MSIRIRTVPYKDYAILVAVCAAETHPMPGDVYIDDEQHYALAAKFARDHHESPLSSPAEYPDIWAAMDTQFVQELRDEWNAGIIPLPCVTDRSGNPACDGLSEGKADCNVEPDGHSDDRDAQEHTDPTPNTKQEHGN